MSLKKRLNFEKASATSVDRLLQLIMTRIISSKNFSSFGVVPIHFWVCMNAKMNGAKSLDLNMLLQINEKIISSNLLRIDDSLYIFAMNNTSRMKI